MSTNIRNILIRADSSSKIGTGHIMRDLVLAKQYLQDNIIFATQELAGNINHKITEAGYTLEILNSNNIQEIDMLIKTLHIDMIVFDHYDIDYAFEKQLKKQNPELKLMVLDDTYEQHYCDILLNHNIYAKELNYLGKVPSQCKLLCGSKYTLLRDEFIQEKKKRQKKPPTTHSPLPTIFVAMGGADTQTLNIPILKLLQKIKGVKVNIISTTANKNLTQLKYYCRNKKWTNLHINSLNVAKLIAKSDLAIITPSVTANEVYFMGIPFIAIQTTKNQSYMFHYLKSKRFFVLRDFNKNKLLNQIFKFQEYSYDK